MAIFTLNTTISFHWHITADESKQVYPCNQSSDVA